jgi:hypothetical protein
MTDDERLVELLRKALEPRPRGAPPRDLWPLVVQRSHGPARWAGLDLVIVAVVAVVLLMRPGWLWLLAFHL